MSDWIGMSMSSTKIISAGLLYCVPVVHGVLGTGGETGTNTYTVSWRAEAFNIKGHHSCILHF